MMKHIEIVNKKRQLGLKEVFIEKQPAIKLQTDNIYHDPARLLKRLNLLNITTEEPIKNITVAGAIWEFYLLALIDTIPRNKYKRLTKQVEYGKVLEGCRRTKLGNPYNQFISNYGKINNSEKKKELKYEVNDFARRLISRGCPIRQKSQRNNEGFVALRKEAAKSFLKYLLGKQISKTDLEQLGNRDGFVEKLIYLLRKDRDSDLYLAVALMLCLYGGKNTAEISCELAKLLCRLMKQKYKGDDFAQSLICLIEKKSSNANVFRPLFKNIYNGLRDRVIISFRIPTWLKLMEDASNVIK